MNAIHIKNDGVTLEIDSPKAPNTIAISIDNPNNQCVDNNYNGDYACMTLTLDNVRELHSHLTNILNQA